jgi:putative SOS response-associated peptidase YedK
MCGRFEMNNPNMIQARFHTINVVPDMYANYDVRPQTSVATVIVDDVLDLMKWGLVPSWSKDGKIKYSTINARIEGIEDSKLYGGPFRRTRTIIPASAFFEWPVKNGVKHKVRIARTDGEMFGFAGLCETWHDKEGVGHGTCTIITRPSTGKIQAVHDREPVILLPDEEEEWINPDYIEPSRIHKILEPYPVDWLTVKQVSS